MSLSYTLMEAFSPEGKAKMKTAAKIGAGLAGALGAGAAAYHAVKSGDGISGVVNKVKGAFSGDKESPGYKVPTGPSDPKDASRTPFKVPSTPTDPKDTTQVPFKTPTGPTDPKDISKSPVKPGLFGRIGNTVDNEVDKAGTAVKQLTDEVVTKSTDALNKMKANAENLKSAQKLNTTGRH